MARLIFWTGAAAFLTSVAITLFMWRGELTTMTNASRAVGTTVATPAPAPPQAPSQTYALTCRLVYHNRASVPTTARVEMPWLASVPPYTQASDVTFDPPPIADTMDGRGNRTAIFELKDVPPGAKRAVRMSARIRAWQVVVDVDARKVGSGAAVGHALRPFLSAEEGVPVDDPVLRKAAAEICAGEANVWYRVVGLYDYTRSLQFQLTHRAQDVRAVLRTRVAQCSDAAALLMTLLRATGVPARYRAGIFIIDETTRTPDTHAWNEVWIQGLGWIPLDPTMARFDDATRISRLAEELPGYIPMWAHTPRAFRGVVTAPADVKASPDDFAVTFEHRMESFENVPSLLARFPVPEAGSARPSYARDELLWAPWKKRLEGPAGASVAALETGLKGAPPWLARSVEGMVDLKTGHLTRAEEKLTEAVALRDSPVTRVNLAWFYVWTRQLSRALDQFSLALRLDGSSLMAWRALVLTYAAIEAWDGVAIVADRARIRHPDLAEFHSEVGQACMRLREYARGRDAFQRAVQLVPDDGWTHAMLGWMLRETGDLEGARRELARGLSLGVDGIERGFFENMLAQLEKRQP